MGDCCERLTTHLLVIMVFIVMALSAPDQGFQGFDHVRCMVQ